MERTRIEPGPGQESVWDYPRPPRAEATTEHVSVVLGGQPIADTRRAIRVLETSSPPVYYIPLDDVADGVLRADPDHTTWCEWKGRATYLDATAGGREARRAAWIYRSPHPEFAALRDHVAFYPGRVDACFVDGEQVLPQAGDYYGGWITSRIVGPFKGEPGTERW